VQSIIELLLDKKSRLQENHVILIIQSRCPKLYRFIYFRFRLSVFDSIRKIYQEFLVVSVKDLYAAFNALKFFVIIQFFHEFVQKVIFTVILRNGATEKLKIYVIKGLLRLSQNDKLRLFGQPRMDI